MKLIFAAVTSLLGAVSRAAAGDYYRNDTSESQRQVAYGKQTRHHPKHKIFKNWAGAVKHGHEIGEVIARMNVPWIPAPNDGQGYGMAAWVGIDGTSGCKSLLQTGIDWYKHKDGTVKYKAWYEWYPESSEDSWVEIHPGDTIEMHVKANSKTSGSFSIINRSLGQHHTETFDAPPEGVPKLCRKTAEWIIETATEDYYISQVPHSRLAGFPDFGSIQFTSTRLLGRHGWGSAKGADIIDVRPPGMVTLTKCGTSGIGTVQCDYVGPVGGAPGH
ncbi:hypothetical protein AC579_652 [Pseudocercospora musae]|uniref:Concanavalin A-like lectin/glucanase n=1 Tax=Pseudocercospora musae TaxID=113226 RepID=A0A139I8M8_9PEZI|nr:hypothetical protein AC579_652 [Pseudocercospora musae]